MADSAKLLVTLEAKLDRFEKQMKDAGVIAEKGVKDIEDKFSKANPAFSGGFLGGLIGGVAAQGIKEAIHLLDTLHDRFKDIDKTAKLAAISMNDVFGFQSAFGKSGFAEVDKALVTLASLLDRAQRGEQNSLSRIFEVNQVSLSSIKDAGDALFKISNIVSRLTPIQGLEVLQKLGLPGSMLKELSQGEEHLRAMQKAAAETAPNLQALAEQAERFDKLWRAATDNFKSYVIGAIDYSILKLADFLELLAKGLRELDKIGTDIAKFTGLPMAVSPAAGAQSLEDAARSLRDNTPTARIRVGTAGGATPFPIRDRSPNQRLDEFDRANNQIEKHIDLLKAETDAVGLGTKAAAAMKTEAQLLFAAEQAGLPINDSLRESIRGTADRAGDAALALEKAKDKLHQINEASRELGSALADAFKGAVLEGKKLNEVMSQLLNKLASKGIDAAFDLFFKASAGNSTSLFASLFTGKALGGPVMAGSPYMVGERGPEIFVPQTSGMIVPNNVASAMGTGGGTLTFAPTIVSNGASQQDMIAAMAIAQQRFKSEIVPTVRQAMLRRAI